MTRFSGSSLVHTKPIHTANVMNCTLWCYGLVLLIRSAAVVRGVPSSTDELNTLMLQLHNSARQKLLACQLEGQPQAKSMPDLVYDQGIADKAQSWADNCTVGHDTYNDRKTDTFATVGQNFAGNTDFSSAFDSWFAEYPYYNFDANTCAASKTCGHYTQVVWAQTTHIGCAFTECPNTAQFPYGKSIVCNYGPAYVLSMFFVLRCAMPQMSPPNYDDDGGDDDDDDDDETTIIW
ncbi:GLIPR1 protein 1 [Fasciolopsis buskii]|uniref:GLIPR1 protein 1 n=1 Tax=Fasciolopsis buskii TaxID=27845 RepID=A0A8E0RYH6_9TREM|nr:GLIPR1 protein 1 [Fasciolopsis buski]